MTDGTAGASPIPEGSPAPEFMLADHHGVSVSLQRLRAAGRVAVIFFPYAHSSVCTSELRELSDARREFDRLGTTPVGISCDAMFTLRAFADAEAIDVPLLSDFWPHGRVASDYGVFDAERGCALRGSFLVERDGTVGWQTVNELPDPRSLSELLTRLAELSSTGSAG